MENDTPIEELEEDVKHDGDIANQLELMKKDMEKMIKEHLEVLKEKDEIIARLTKERDEAHNVFLNSEKEFKETDSRTYNLLRGDIR